jgi:catalase
MDGVKIRVRSESFADHFSQATMFYNSMSEPEKEHIKAAYTFELGKVTKPEIREREVNEILANIDADLAASVAQALGLPKPKAGGKPGKPKTASSPALSLLNRVQPGIKTRKIALLTAPGADANTLKKLRDAFAKEGATALVVAPTLAPIGDVTPDAAVTGMPSVMFDAVFIPGGEKATETLTQSGDARHFVLEAFKHLKAIGAVDTGRLVLAAAQLPDQADGVASGDEADLKRVLKEFIEAAGQHRVWSRMAQALAVPA